MTGPSPPAKSCGTCTLCCKLLGITEIEKPAWEWCSHCAPGRGCTIYETRPPSCREFECQWLCEPELPESLKPERSKVMLTGAAGPILNAYCDPGHPMAWKREPMYSLLQERARIHWRGSIAVIARAGLRTWLINHDGETDLGIVDPRSEVRFEQQRDGRVRAIVLPPAEGSKPAPGYY